MHERRDIDVRGVLVFAAALLVTAVTLHFALWGLLSALGAGRPVPPAEPAPLPEPLWKIRSDEDAWLSTYGWVDRNAGIVRIPIDRAIEILLQRGLK